MRIIAILIMISLPAAADTLTIDLPELAGGYEGTPFTAPDFGFPQMRVVDLTVPADITSIDHIQLVITGEWTVGEIICDDGTGPETSPFWVDFGLFVTSDAFPGDYFQATIQPPDGPFTDLAGTLTSCCPQGVLGYDDLIGAELHVELAATWALIGFCSPWIDSHGTVSDVRLEITGTVAVEASSWSSVKDLYR